MQSVLKDNIEAQRNLLSNLLSGFMHFTARRLAELIDNRSAMEMLLADELQMMSYCKHLYVLDENCVQLTSNITREGKNDISFGRDRSDRGYMQGILKGGDFDLSDAYISKNKKRPSVTAVHAIRDASDRCIGYLGADYDLRELPHCEIPHKQSSEWQQLKGDPSIRQGLFSQHRNESIFDANIVEVLALIQELIVEHGVFHGKFHFSSSRATVWLFDDPYNYQLLGADELLDPDICLAYPRRKYTDKAIVDREQIALVFEQFKQLRFADENIYLRSGSLNVINGMVGLNFSCDGSHYMHYEEFLDKDMAFWLGSIGEVACAST